jgi:hypothetical protein
VSETVITAYDEVLERLKDLFDESVNEKLMEILSVTDLDNGKVLGVVDGEVRVFRLPPAILMEEEQST